MARKKKIDVDFSIDQPVEEAPDTDVEVQEDVVAEEKPDKVEEPVQVESDTVVFVPFEDFEGRINDETFNYRKDVAVECTVDQANFWVDANKGYIK